MDPEAHLGDVGERSLLRHIRSRIPSGPGVVVGVGDDAAALETGPLTLVTTDSMVEGIHFRREWSPPRLLGRKALTVNLADIGAMAGVPRYATVSLCLPPDLPVAFVDGLYDGLLERAAETGVHIVGGNLSAIDGPIVVDVAVLGQGDRLVRRSGAVPGDLVVVTGTLGAAAAGLSLLKQGARLGSEGEIESTGVWTESSAPALLRCLRAQLDPSPPLALARALAEQEGLVHAGIDLSDGLSGDLGELCNDGDVSAWIDTGTLPVDPQAAGLARASGGNSLELALHGGEDYQLLLAVPPDQLDALRDFTVVWDIPLAVIGEFAPGPIAVSVKTEQGLSPLIPLSHDHFRAARPAAAPGA